MPDPAALEIGSALGLIYFLFQAPAPCCAKNRDLTFCRNNAHGILGGCQIIQHKWQNLKMLIDRQAWARLVRGLLRRFPTYLFLRQYAHNAIHVRSYPEKQGDVADYFALSGHCPQASARSVCNSESFPKRRIRLDVLGALDASGFDWVTPKVWRATVATHLDDMGLTAAEIADQLGNTPAVVERHYRKKRGTQHQGCGRATKHQRSVS